MGASEKAAAAFHGLRVVVSPALPVPPSLTEDVVRTVRHTMAPTLRWLGEDVGPEPGEPTHAYVLPGGVMLASPALADRFRGRTGFDEDV